FICCVAIHNKQPHCLPIKAMSLKMLFTSSRSFFGNKFHESLRAPNSSINIISAGNLASLKVLFGFVSKKFFNFIYFSLFFFFIFFIKLLVYIYLSFYLF